MSRAGTALRPVTAPARTLAQCAAHLAIAPIQGEAGSITATGVSLASASVQPGDVFAALRGVTSHGARFAAEAIKAGAVAVLTDAGGAEMVPPGTPVLQVTDPRAQLGEFAAWFYGNPARRLTTLGITGTNGKTTIAYMLEAALKATGQTPAMLGTIEARIGERTIASKLTTMEAPDLQAAFAAMAEDGIDAVAMEASSQAIERHRVDGFRFDVAGFTNLSRDHLDYHGDFEAYYQAKKLLFTPGHAKAAVICVDDEWGRRLAAEAEIPVTTLTTRPPSEVSASFYVTEVTPDDDGYGSDFTLADAAGHVLVRARAGLPGLFSCANASVALLMVRAVGRDVSRAAGAIGRVNQIRGRLQRVEVPGGPLGVVDFAHTPDGVAAAVRALREITPGKLMVAVGCGGDRDKGKRPMMGQAAASASDLVVITDDNPRTEDPAAIRAATRAGAEQVAGPEVIEVSPRGEAIAEMVRRAGKGDTILLVGKGHEPYQLIGNQVLHFDDAEELERLLEEKWR